MCTGSKVTYRIQIDHIQLPGFCISRGNVPVNITVAPDIINQLGIGCHRLTIYASNTVTFSDVSAHLEVSLPGPQPSIFGPILFFFLHETKFYTSCRNLMPLSDYLFLCLSLDLCAGENKWASSLCVGRQGGKSKLGERSCRCFPWTGSACSASLHSAPA